MRKKENILDFIIRRGIQRLKGVFVIFCIGAIIAIGMAIITYEPSRQYPNSQIRDTACNYVQIHKEKLEKLAVGFVELCPHTRIYISRDWIYKDPGMVIYCNGERNDTFKYKRELFSLYKDCYDIKPQYETGPEVLCEQDIVRFPITFGINLCGTLPQLFFTKLDTTELKSRYPSLPYYPKESQPRDSECTYIWELDDNWYIIAD